MTTPTTQREADERAAIDRSEAPAPLNTDTIDTLARKHNLDGSMLIGHRHDYWRAFAADVIRAVLAGQAAPEAPAAATDQPSAGSGQKSTEAES